MKQLPYTASDKHQRPLITVLAKNEDHARQEIKKQLNQNESRRACYTQWMAAGQPIKIKRTIDTEKLFRDAYKGCESYGDWDRLIAQMTDDLRVRIYDALVLVQATCDVTMREDAFIVQLKHHLPAKPAKQVPLMVKTTLGDWNNGHTSMNANCRYKGTTTCWGIMVAGAKTIAFRRKMDAQLFCDFVDFTEYNGSGDPESMFFKWVVEQSKDIDLDDIKVVG